MGPPFPYGPGIRPEDGFEGAAQAPADLRSADGRFPDDPGHHAISGRQRGRDGVVDHDAARATVRPDQRVVLDEFDQLVRNLDDNAPIRSRPADRRGRAGRAGRD